MTRRFSSVVLFFLAVLSSAWSQEAIDRSKLNGLLLSFNFGVHIPQGDLSDRFGIGTKIGGGVDYRIKGGKWSISSGIDYFFGNNVKEDVLNNIRSEQGYLIGTDGLPADVFLRERGMNINLSVYRMWDFLKGNNQFGPILGVGGGFMTHWIRVQDDRQTADQIRGDYLMGYDRRSFGPSLYQFIGVRYLDNNKRMNFIAGFDIAEGFTKSIRPWDFANNKKDSSTRLDVLYGFRLGWILPFYFKEPTEEIYY
jgi:hypothetical protein